MSLQNTNRLNKRNMELLLRSLTPPMIYEVVRDLKIRLRRTAKYRKYKIGQHVITIPGDHTLPAFQGVSRLYDRFLPVLCSQLPPQGVIVDVGANVGDTTAAIIQTCTNRIIAIAYFEILRGNPTVVDPDRRVTALLGSGAQIGSLIADRGTGTLHNKRSARMQSLDDVLAGWLDQVVLLKVDTDGLDTDIISSGIAMIKAYRPMLFWEGGTSGAVAFESMYQKLAAAEYDRFWVFDNFGNLILCECGIKEPKDFDRYVASQYQHRSTRTVF